MRDLQHVIDDYRPEITSLDTLSSSCSPPPSSAEPKTTQISVKETEKLSKVTAKQADVWSRYNDLSALLRERLRVAEEFVPSVQQYNSSRGAWEDKLCGWEERVSGLSPPATNPAVLEEQIQEIKVHVFIVVICVYRDIVFVCFYCLFVLLYLSSVSFFFFPHLILSSSSFIITFL